MKYWTRTTHNFNNETREWEYREIELQELKFKEKTCLGVHALDSGRWSSFWEIYKQHEEYNKGNPYESFLPSQEMVLQELEEMEELGLVKSKPYKLTNIK